MNSCRVDGAAETMNVHVRRIYELIKILEILSLIEVDSMILSCTYIYSAVNFSWCILFDSLREEREVSSLGKERGILCFA